MALQQNLHMDFREKKKQLLQTKITNCNKVLEHLLDLIGEIHSGGDDKNMCQACSIKYKENVKLFIFDNYREIIYEDDLVDYSPN